MNVDEFIAILPKRYAALFQDNAERGGYSPERNIKFTLLAMHLFDPGDFYRVMELIRGIVSRAKGN